MKQAFIIVVCFCFAVMTACNSEKKPEQQQPEAVKPMKECYQSVANKDTVSLTLDIADQKITGLLTFNLFEKDKNQGTLVGEVKGDTLIADYTFMSEGVTSMREVVFLKRNNQLIEGFGEMTVSEGKEVFKNKSNLSFDNSLVLIAIECEKK